MTGKVIGVPGYRNWASKPTKSIPRRVLEGLTWIVWPPWPVYRYGKPKLKFVKSWRRKVDNGELVLVWEPER